MQNIRLGVICVKQSEAIHGMAVSRDSAYVGLSYKSLGPPAPSSEKGGAGPPPGTPSSSPPLPLSGLGGLRNGATSSSLCDCPAVIRHVLEREGLDRGKETHIWVNKMNEICD